MYLKFAQVREVKTPSRGHATDAGIDFFIPEFNESFINDLKEKNPRLRYFENDKKINLDSTESILIPSGIKVEIPFGYMGLFLNKSGVASKKQLLVGAQVVDTYYSGEVHINLHNVGEKSVDLFSGDKVVQMVLTPILSCDLTEVSEDMLYDWMQEDSTRGEGGFGSTGS